MVSSVTPILDSGYSVALARSYGVHRTGDVWWWQVYPDDTEWYTSDKHGLLPRTLVNLPFGRDNKYSYVSPSSRTHEFVSKFNGKTYAVTVGIDGYRRDGSRVVYLRSWDIDCGETGAPDPCADVSCPDKCVGVDKYDQVCQDGICVRGTLIQTNSEHCGYTPEPTPDPTPTPSSDTYIIVALMLAGTYMILRR